MKMKRLADALLPTEMGTFRIMAFSDDVHDPLPAIALVNLDQNQRDNILVRIHSECMTGDIFHSRKCDCGEQLDSAMLRIAQEGGVLIYLRQEGRGIGIVQKILAYHLQEQGADTIEANVQLGHAVDARTYEKAIAILQDLQITSIRLLTNNPDKIQAIEDSSITLLAREAIIIPPNPDNKSYLSVKKTKLRQML